MNEPSPKNVPPTGRLFAVIPAAGLSRRMGRPKLTLPLGGKPVLQRLLEKLDRTEITARVVVTRQADQAVADLAESTGAWAVRPEVDPPDMRASVQFGLAAIEQRFSPVAADGWILLPADHPLLDADVLTALLQRWRTARPTILVPTFQGKRGHPTFFRWPLAAEALALPADCGLNQLLRQHQQDVLESAVTSPDVLTDLDTPADFERLKLRFEACDD